MPVRYRDKNDFALGEWIVYNRQRYLGGNLTQNRIERLEAIGMVWSTSNDLWEQNYAAATQLLSGARRSGSAHQVRNALRLRSGGLAGGPARSSCSSSVPSFS